MSTVPHTPTEASPFAEVRLAAEAARNAARVLAALTEQQRNAALEAMAVAIERNAAAILEANAEDLRLAQSLLASGELSEATHSRLALTPHKVTEMAAQVRAVAELPDPLGRQLDAIELDSRLDLEKLSVPLGVLAIIFEARPDAVTQISALALKSGNAVLLKAGKEVERTAGTLVRLLRAALAGTAVPPEALALLTGREQVHHLLQLSSLVDLVIPRGSKALVEFVQANTRIPVLGHSEGVCHIFVDRSANHELALRVVDDAKTDYPAACNAVETILLDREIAPALLPPLAAHLRSRGVHLVGDGETRSLLGNAAVDPVADWHTEYGDLTLALRIVADLDEAIAHIHQFGSAHTDAILTEDAAHAARFLREVDSASVFHNASTRFADGFRYGLGAEVGVSTARLHARGPVGLEGLTTYKYILRGAGQVAGDYRGPNARPFTHRRPAGAG